MKKESQNYFQSLSNLRIPEFPILIDFRDWNTRQFSGFPDPNPENGNT